MLDFFFLALNFTRFPSRRHIEIYEFNLQTLRVLTCLSIACLLILYYIISFVKCLLFILHPDKIKTHESIWGLKKNQIKEEN